MMDEDRIKSEGGIEAPNEVHWHDESQFVKSDIMKEFEDVTNTGNYHGVRGEIEPIKVMEWVMIEYAKRNIPPEKAMRVALAIKYLLRAGTKDDFNKEMFKAINYITRARYDKWLPSDFNKKMGGE